MIENSLAIILLIDVNMAIVAYLIGGLGMAAGSLLGSIIYFSFFY